MTDSTVGNHRSLEGKVAIITGGASGIGEATARLFAQHGTRMVVIADIQDQLGKHVASSIGIDKCSYVHCDVSDEDQVKHIVESTVEKYGKLDIMFSNAGIVSSSERQIVLELDISRFDRLFAVNVRGMALCVKHAARAMVKGGVRGSIVCTGSVAASHGSKGRTDYCVTKHAVVGLVRSASLQLGEHGIRVNSVSPNGLATPLTCGMLGKSVEEVEKVYETFARLKGVTLKVEHVADAVLFLVCNEFVSGHDLVVDGVYVPGSSSSSTT